MRLEGAPIEVEACRYAKPELSSVILRERVDFTAVHGASMESHSCDRYTGAPPTSQGGNPSRFAFRVT